MTAFKDSIQSAFAFAETLPSAGTMFRPDAFRAPLLAAREGVFVGAVVSAIVDARAVSSTADDFIKATDGSIDADRADALYSAEATADAAARLAEQVIKQYGSAENFARHAIAC